MARNSDGVLISGYHRAELSNNVEYLEARAIFAGIRLGLQNEWNVVEIESDAVGVINNLRGTNKSWRIETTI